MVKQRVRLAYLVSHPIQYQAPLLRRIAAEPDINLTVLFGSDFSARGYRDRGFGVNVTWDVPLLEGYKSRVLPALHDNGTVSATAPISRHLLGTLRDRAGRPAFDALWVHGYASINTLHGILAANALGIPVLLRAESWSGDRPRSLAKKLFKRAFFAGLKPMVTATLPIGSHNATYWREVLGETVPQFPMPYAVDNGFFTQTASTEAQAMELRATLQMDLQRPVVLFASKLQSRKNADHLVRATHTLARQYGIRPYLLLVGEGEERVPLQGLVSSLNMAADVRFLGFRNQSELPAFFAMADVFVLPSRHEPWGLIVNEAMAAGCAVVVSSDVGSGPDLVLDGVNGFVFPVGDEDALASALAKVLEAPETSQRMGTATRQRIAHWDFEADVAGLRQALSFATGRLRP